MSNDHKTIDPIHHSHRGIGFWFYPGTGQVEFDSPPLATIRHSWTRFFVAGGFEGTRPGEVPEAVWMATKAIDLMFAEMQNFEGYSAQGLRQSESVAPAVAVLARAILCHPKVTLDLFSIATAYLQGNLTDVHDLAANFNTLMRQDETADPEGLG